MTVETVKAIFLPLAGAVLIGLALVASSAAGVAVEDDDRNSATLASRMAVTLAVIGWLLVLLG